MKHLLSTISYKTNPYKLWTLIRTINKTYIDSPDTDEAITSNRNTILSPKQQSNLFNQHYSSLSRLPHYTKDKKIDRPQRKLRPQNDPPLPFAINMTKQAIEQTKPTASVGPDGVSYRHLKQLAPVAIGALTDIFNLSIQQNTIPKILKLGKIKSILKPSKSPTEPSSYTPVTVLCNFLEILEEPILNPITLYTPSYPPTTALRPKTLQQHLPQHSHNTCTKGWTQPNPYTVHFLPQ